MPDQEPRGSTAWDLVQQQPLLAVLTVLLLASNGILIPKGWMASERVELAANKTDTTVETLRIMAAQYQAQSDRQQRQINTQHEQIARLQSMLDTYSDRLEKCIAAYSQSIPENGGSNG